jgi:hypothetical protein
MEISISTEELRKRKIMVATPMYGGQCAGMYTKSSVDLSAVAQQYGMDVRFFYLFNESLITRARNYCVDEFMRSDCTHLMFIDSDIGFDPNDVLTLAALQSENPDDDEYDIICGPYPKKCISWEKIKAAVDKGYGDEDPEQLQRYVGDYVFNPAGDNAEIRLDQPVEVLEGGTGFMMIRKSTFVKFAAAYPHLSYRPDHVRTAAFDGSREIVAYFDALIDDKNANIAKEVKGFYEKNPDATAEDVVNFLDDPKLNIDNKQYSNRYLSEDYMFCQWARKIGLKVWFCPWMNLQHMGSYVFGGSLTDLAQIGASATADMSKIGKQKTPGVHKKG